MSEEEKQIHLYMHSKNELGLATLCVEKDKEIERLKESEEYFKDCINDFRSIYESLCYSAPEMTPVFLEQMKEIFDDIEEMIGDDKE